MQIGELARDQDINIRIFQLERRMGMDWYSKEQLLDDLYSLRELVYMLARKHDGIKNQINNYYNKIDHLVDQLV